MTMGERKYGLGRLVLPDQEDFRYLMRSAVRQPESILPPMYTYEVGPALDQGATSECVGYAWEQWLRAEPITQFGPGPNAIYCGAQRNDPWPGDCSNPLYDGSTVRGGAKWLQQHGYIKTYLWAFTTRDISLWLRSGNGPVVLGTTWYMSMFTPDETGVVHVDISQGDAGGHAYLCIGADENRQMFLCINSWGKEWGKNGMFWIRYKDMDLLMNQQGEAATAVELRHQPNFRYERMELSIIERIRRWLRM